MKVCPSCRAIYSTRATTCVDDLTNLVEGGEDPLLGRTIDRYLIIERLGEGGVGCVYRAQHVTLPRDHAIKVLFRDRVIDRKAMERFRREAQAASSIKHPSIVQVVDFVSAPEGITFIVMDLVRGSTLEHVLHKSGPFSPYRAANVARQIAGGLGEAHKMGFVHRDVKPANIMLASSRNGEVAKLLDFGVVRMTDVAFESQLTGLGHFVGTAMYSAPEQLKSSAVGPTADFYSLGTVLFQMLTGKAPFTGPGMAKIVTQHLTEAPPRLPKSGGLEQLTLWLLEKDPARRPQRAGEIVQAIESLNMEPVEAHDTMPLPHLHDTAPLQIPTDDDTELL